MFALSEPPPGVVAVAGAQYRLVRVFKHDFFAATCLYEQATSNNLSQTSLVPPPGVPLSFSLGMRGRTTPSTRTGGGGTNSNDWPPERIVVKLGRVNGFCALPMDWYGRWIKRHEEAIYSRLSGIEGVPRWVGVVSDSAFAIEYIDAKPLDHLAAPPPGLFDRLRRILDAIHARGVGYCDANKKSNILVLPDGRPFLIDYQIAMRLRDDLPWPIRAIVAWAVGYVQRSDIYHLYKHKRRMCPGELTLEEESLSRRRGLLHVIHRKMSKPWRAMRRALLRRWQRQGKLESPTEHLEDHYQPEKKTWRK